MARDNLTNRALVPVLTGLAVLGMAVSSCGAIRAANKIRNAVEGNKSTIDSFTSKIQSGQPTAFEATYVTSGSSPATVIYAVQPPNGIAFTETPTGAGNSTSVNLIANKSGEYSCTPASTTHATCQKLGTSSASSENQLFNFYTPSHWVTFLKDFSLAAGFAGDSVTSSTMSVNGFNMQCVDFRATGVQGTSTICTTTQGILGYVKVASDNTSFEITNYSSSPSNSLFQLPVGAAITTEPQPN